MAEYIELSSEMSFLVIDDVASFREIIIHILKKLGFKTTFQAIDASFALSTIRCEKIDFIICERNLRQCSGMELLKEIRESTDMQRIPFMMMAADIPKEDVVLASEFGVDGFLKKPFVINDVSSRLTTCMQRYRDPENPENRFEAARLAYLAGKYEEAIKIYKTLQEKLPASARVLTGIARCLRINGDIEAAETHLKAAIKANPMYVHAFHDLGLIYLQTNRDDEALQSFSKAIDISPSNPIRYESIGDILIDKGRFEDAEKYLMRAVKLELAYPALFAQIGKALFAQKKSDKAIEFFQRALKEQPQNVSFMNSLGICMKSVGRLDDSMNYYNQALKLKPTDVKVLFNKCLCLISLKEFERAKKTCHQILKIDPSFEKAKTKLDEISKIEAEKYLATHPQK